MKNGQPRLKKKKIRTKINFMKNNAGLLLCCSFLDCSQGDLEFLLVSVSIMLGYLCYS